MEKRLLLPIFIIVTAVAGAAFGRSRAVTPKQSAAWYFGAHADDVVLFKGPHFYADVASGVAVNVIIATAGDGGHASSPFYSREPFFRAREEGLKSTIRFILDSEGRLHSEAERPVVVSGHRINAWSYGDVTVYFLRLPDGDTFGNGFGADSGQSLKNLAEGKSIAAVDQSTTYASWNDLLETLRNLLTEGGSQIDWLNLTETRVELNPEDHSDHIFFSHAIQDAVGTMCVKKRFFVNYHSATLPRNVTLDDLEDQTAAFAVMSERMNELGYDISWNAGHRRFLGREYFREDVSCNAPPAPPSGTAAGR